MTRAADLALEVDRNKLVRLVVDDDDPQVRAIALALVVRQAPRLAAAAAWRHAACDSDGRVRLRAAQLAPKLGRSVPNASLVALLGDDDAWVAEAAAYAAGEHPRPTRRLLDALVGAVMSHDDPLVREAAVAALGAQGDPSTLHAVLHACDDKPAIRRRAVLALAAFDGPEVEARLRAALEDRDWQTRQAAEELVRPGRL